MSRRTVIAQRAYSSRDSDLSRAVHQSTELAEIASGKNDFLHGIPPSASFTSCPYTAAVLGTQAAMFMVSALIYVRSDVTWTVWCVGSTVCFFFAFLSAMTEEKFRNEFSDFEKLRERWEVENFPEGEIQEMVQIYTGYGMSDEDALSVASTLSKYPDFWIDHMLLHEIGIIPSSMKPSGQSYSQIWMPLATFLAAFIPATIFLANSDRMGWAWIGVFTQLLIVLYVKAAKFQWLSYGACISTVISIILTSGAITMLVKFLLPASSMDV